MHVQICKKCLFTFRIVLTESSVLLDDCLAAVDSHVARHIFGESRRIYYLNIYSDS